MLQFNFRTYKRAISWKKILQEYDSFPSLPGVSHPAMEAQVLAGILGNDALLENSYFRNGVDVNKRLQ